MTIFYATNDVFTGINVVGAITNGTSERDSFFTDSNAYLIGAIMEYPLPSVQDDLWIHMFAQMSLHQQSGPSFGGWNTSANRYDWYLWRSTAGWMQFYMWNGSTMVAVGNQYPEEEPENVSAFDFHYVAHATEGMLELYWNENIIVSAYGLDTSAFAIDLFRIISTSNSPIHLSQLIIADEMTLNWRVSNKYFNGVTEGIKTVGRKIQTLAGASSGTTDIALNSGLVDGIDTSVQPDDYVVAFFAAASTSDLTLSITDPSAANYTLLGTEMYANDTFDTNLRVAVKKMGPTPDAYVRFGNTGSANNAGIIGVLVLRGVDPTTFLDVAVQSIATINTGAPNPPAITPVSPQTIPFFIMASAHNGTLTSITNPSNLLDFIQLVNTGVNSIHFAMGRWSEWLSGSVDPGLATATTNVNTFSNASFSIAPKPIQVAQTFSKPETGVTGVTSSSGKFAGSYIAANNVNQVYRARGREQTLPNNSFQVKGVSVNARVRRGDTGPQSANLLVRTDKVDYHGSDQSISETIDSISTIWETNPDTGLPWTMDEANKALVGIRSRT